MISLNSIAHVYATGHHLVFKDWQIERGAQCLILGSSGSGKTTLLHILTGLLKPSTGTVNIDGTSIYNLKGNALDTFRGKNIGIVFQKAHLLKSLTVTENLLIAQSLANQREDRKHCMQVLKNLGLYAKDKSYPHELSQGQMQRVAIARALINRPKIIVADEPTSSLDDKNTETVIDLLKEQAQLYHATLIISTHDKRVKNSFEKTYLLADEYSTDKL